MPVFSVCSITMNDKVYSIEFLASGTRLRPRFRNSFRRSAIGRVVGKRHINDITGSLLSRVRRKTTEKIRPSAVSSSSILSTPMQSARMKKEVPDNESVSLDNDETDNLQRIIDLVAIGALGGNATSNNYAMQCGENNCEMSIINRRMEDPVVEDCDNEIKIEEESLIVNENYLTIETPVEFLKQLEGLTLLYDKLFLIHHNEDRLPFLVEKSETVTRVLLALLNSYFLELLHRIAIVAQSDAMAIDEQCIFSCYRDLVTDRLLLQHLWHRVSEQDFWRVIFPCMCDIAFFVNVPQTVREQKTMFASMRLDFLKNQRRGGRQNSDNDADPEDTIARIMGEDDRDEQPPTASAEITDRVYRAMRLEFFTILRGFLHIIWKILLKVDSDISIHPSERNELIANAYTFASFHGCILLSAPLSIFASLDAMNSANFIQVEKLRDCLDNKYCGRIFETTIAYTLFAVIHYTMVSRGFRPVHIWPIRGYSSDNEHNESKCPWFLLNHIALGLYHFQRGFIYSGLIVDNCASCCGTANRVSATVDTDTYNAVCFKRVVNVCLARDVQREYDLFSGKSSSWNEFPTDDRCLYELTGYLNLRIENVSEAHNITRVYSKHYLKVHCNVTELLQTNTCTHCSDNHDRFDSFGEENLFRPYQPRRERNEAVSNVEEPDSSTQSSNCLYHDIEYDPFLSTRDKFSLLHEDMINILSVSSHRVSHHHEFLRFQIHGVSAFPIRSLCIHKHLRALNVLFMRQTARLVT